MGNADAFDTAIRRVNADRGKDYGHPADNFRRAAALRAVVEECTDPVLRQALGCITDKVARLIQNPHHLDSWIDVAGYARCGCMILDRQKAGSQPADVEDLTAQLREQLRQEIRKEIDGATGTAAQVGRDLQGEAAGARDGAGPLLDTGSAPSRDGADRRAVAGRDGWDGVTPVSYYDPLGR